MQVSVVICLYNKAGCIERALDTVVGQTRGDFEVIVVDDGSTDGSAEVVRGYSDPRVRLAMQENAGAAAARNRGTREASTNLIAFLDADDVWDADFLETVLALRERFPQAAVWATARRHIHADGQISHPAYHGRLPASSEGGLIQYFLGERGHSPLHSSAVLVRKDALLAAGGFPDGVVLCEDHDAWLRLALRYQIAWSPLEKVTYYEVAGNRVSDFAYLGNYPFFNTLRAFQKEVGPGQPLPEGIHAYLARRHTGLLSSHWLAGEVSVVREIVRDCHRIRGYRLKCYRWYLLSWIPRPVVTFVWKTRRRLTGRGSELPQFRSIYPVKYRTSQTC